MFGLSTLNSNRTKHKLRKKLANQKRQPGGTPDADICPFDSSARFEHDTLYIEDLERLRRRKLNLKVFSHQQWLNILLFSQIC